MIFKNIELHRLSESELIRLNFKLPKPKQKIVGHVSVLPVTIAMGCQIDLLLHNDLRHWLKHGTCFLLDNKKISFPSLTHNTSDATNNFLETGGDYYCVGSASLHGMFENHLDVLYSSQFFGFSKDNLVDIPLAHRQDWCCTMFKKNPIRDLIADILQSQYTKKFTDNTWFCYDGIEKSQKNLIKLMFKKPGETGFTSIETCKDIDNNQSKYWGNLKFTDTFMQKTFYQRVKNTVGEHIGHLLGPWHQQNLIELVPEATFEYFEPTEKIVKPIRAGMPFVAIGCKKFLYRLRKMGFRTFHPYIDESYDLENNWKKRTKMAVNSMFTFLSNPNHLDEIEKICKYNQNVILKIGRHDPVCRIAKKLKPLVSFE